LPTPHHDDAVLAEDARETEEPARVSRHQQMRLMPMPKHPFGRECHGTTQMFAQATLHAAVPAFRHAARSRVPCCDEDQDPRR
jgi:hypothetical protein